MSDRVLTSHAGSLPRPDDLRDLNQRRAEGGILQCAGDDKLDYRSAWESDG